MAQSTPPNYVAISDVAAQFEVSERTVWLWIRQGKVRSVQPGGRGGKHRIPASELDRLRAGRPIDDASWQKIGSRWEATRAPQRMAAITAPPKSPNTK